MYVIGIYDQDKVWSKITLKNLVFATLFNEILILLMSQKFLNGEVFGNLSDWIFIQLWWMDSIERKNSIDKHEDNNWPN